VNLTPAQWADCARAVEDEVFRAIADLDEAGVLAVLEALDRAAAALHLPPCNVQHLRASADGRRSIPTIRA
jgi:hypothetical protein